MNADTPAARVRMVRIAVDNWNLSSCNIKPPDAVRARQYSKNRGARLLPRRISIALSRLLDFSTTYKRGATGRSGFWENDTMRKCIVTPRSPGPGVVRKFRARRYRRI